MSNAGKRLIRAAKSIPEPTMRDDRSHLGRDAEHFERYRAPEPDVAKWAVFGILVLAGMWLAVVFLQWIGVL